MNLYERIRKAMDTDSEPEDSISMDLGQLYDRSSDKDKLVIDNFCRILTGWTLKKLMEGG